MCTLYRGEIIIWTAAKVTVQDTSKNEQILMKFSQIIRVSLQKYEKIAVFNPKSIVITILNVAGHDGPGSNLHSPNFMRTQPTCFHF